MLTLRWRRGVVRDRRVPLSGVGRSPETRVQSSLVITRLSKSAQKAAEFCSQALATARESASFHVLFFSATKIGIKTRPFCMALGSCTDCRCRVCAYSVHFYPSSWKSTAVALPRRFITMDPFMTALVTSVLGTVRVFVVLLVGVLASKWPSERECGWIFWCHVACS